MKGLKQSNVACYVACMYMADWIIVKWDIETNSVCVSEYHNRSKDDLRTIRSSYEIRSDQ